MYKAKTTRWLLLLPATVVALAAGCTTFTSTLLERREDDVLCQHDYLKLKGVPITVQVPSHLDVRITESYLVGKTENGLEEIEIPGGPVRGVTTTIVKSKKIFVVDFKRPASGTLEYELGFSDEQYLNKIANKIEDTTFADVRSLVTTAIPLFAGAPTSASAVDVGESLKSRISQNVREIAYRRFDINAPNFEDELNWFIGQYITHCNDCIEFRSPGAAPTLPGAESQTTLGLDASTTDDTPGEPEFEPVFEDGMVTVYSEAQP